MNKMMIENSFKAPFDELDQNTGKRLVDAYWMAGGHAEVKENFVRLTHDRASRQGWVYNTIPVQEPDNWSIYLRFRISGKGKTLFGDGLAVWFEQNPKNVYRQGSLHGHTDEFSGFGVIFDTFVNTDPGHSHYDISLVTGIPGKPVDLNEQRPGCDSKYRYWEGRDDFNVNSESRAKITLRGNNVVVEIDPTSSGTWTECFHHEIIGLPPNWKKNTHFAISASTGALADNHDVLEFMVGKPDKIDLIKEKEHEESSKPAVVINISDTNLDSQKIGEHVNDLAYNVKYIDSQLKNLHHEMEMQMDNMKTEISKMITSIQLQEGRLEERVLSIENRQESRFLKQIEGRLKELDKSMKDNFEIRLKAIENQLRVGLTSAEEKGSSWVMPFIFITLILFAGMGYMYFNVRKISARDKLF